MSLQTLSYHDGATLSYAETGDPHGFPVLIQHGLIASIRDNQLFNGLRSAGARLIAIARPGYGESTPHPMNNMAEWGEIVALLVEELRLTQFDVLGMSSGAPYSYAIAWRMPAKTRRLWILSGTPALFDDAVLAHWPYPVDRQAGLAELQTLAHELFFAHASPAELARDDMRDSLRWHSFGIAQDFKLRCQDWGFGLSEIATPVRMRHSRADDSVPLITAELTARQLPNCQFEVREHDPHFSQAVLDDFLSTWPAE